MAGRHIGMIRCGLVSVILFACFSIGQSCNHRDVTVDISSDVVEWRLCNKAALAQKGINGSLISLASFEQHDSHTEDCFAAAAVPGTVLTNMVQNGFFDGVQDLFVDKNLERVPDIHDVGREYYTYYWRTALNLSKLGLNDTGGCDLRLSIRSLNYRATVFHNGKEVPPEIQIKGESGAVGMFHRWTYILRQGRKSLIINQKRSLEKSGNIITVAILVEPPDFTGRVTGDQGGDHDIAKNAAIQQYTAGWDWIRGTPDRNTGLWDRVSLQLSDPTVSIRHVHVQTLTNSTSPHPDHVSMGVSVTLIHQSPSSTSTWSGNDNFIYITATVVETNEASSFRVPVGDLTCEDHFGERCEATLELPPIQMENPDTWMPHNYGHAHLYHLNVIVQSTCQIAVHSRHETKFGIRTFTNYVDPVTQGRVFLCNGVKIFLQGGNWIGTDQFHRYSTSRARYKNEVALHKSMGLNLIRVWGGGITERPEFYEATDEAGMLVLQEFWMTGDNNGRWAGSYQYPINHQVYLGCAKDMILMLRNHASLLLWVGGNELYPEEKSPPTDIASGLTSLMAKLDPDRFYIPSSTANHTHYDPAFALAPKDGPYGFLTPSDFYKRNPGLHYTNGTIADTLKLGFQPEVGSSSTPTYRGIKKFLTAKYANAFPSLNDTYVPSVFEFHNYLSYTDDRGHDHIYAYGTPKNMSGYCFRAQLAQYAQVKGLFEGYARHIWTYYTAVLYWKTQSPWPSFRGFMYDSWLETTGGYWGAHDAMESGQPLHIQLGNWTVDTTVVIINRSPNHYEGIAFSVSCQWWDLNGTILVSQNYSLDGSELKANSVHMLNTKNLAFPQTASLGIAYLRLVLNVPTSARTSRMLVCSFNDYYMSDPSKDQNYNKLGEWREDPKRLLDLDLECINNKESKIMVQLTNPSKAIALQIRVRMDSETEKYFYSSQYFSLLPSETKVIEVTEMLFDDGTGSLHQPRDTTKLILIADGLNVKPHYHACETVHGANGRE